MKQTDILSLLQEAEQLANGNMDNPADSAFAQRAAVDAPPLASGGKLERQDAIGAIERPVQPIADRLPVSEQVTPERALPPSQPTVRTEVPVQPVAPVASPGMKDGPQTAVEPKLPQNPVREGSTNDESADQLPVESARERTWHDQVPMSHGAVVSKGLLFVFGFLAVFLAWAVIFPISSAVVASGKVISSGQNKLIQHPVGGVVRVINVAEGDFVEKGKVILNLDKSAASAELSRLLARQQSLEAQKVRYDTEQQGKNAKFPKIDAIVTEVSTEDKSAVDEISKKVAVQRNTIFEQQRTEFEAGRKRLNAQLDTIAFQIENLKDQKTGLNSRVLGARKLLTLTKRDLSKIRPLANDGYVPKSRLWELEKTQLEQLTEVQNLLSQVDAIDQRISESESKLAEIDQLDRETRSEELSKVMGELAELSEPIQAARSALELTELRAPVAGVITKLAANTVGGVMAAGEPVAEIVPRGAELQVEFRVPLNKSKHVTQDKDIRVHMATFNRRLYDPIEGKVTYVSADSLTDDKTGDAYFLARAVLSDDPSKNTGVAEISAGMAAEVYVLTEPRVFASYVLQPLIDSFNRAFREI